jgi:hypothetical protein
MVAQLPDNPRSALFRWIDTRDPPFVSRVERTMTIINADAAVSAKTLKKITGTPDDQE